MLRYFGDRRKHLAMLVVVFLGFLIGYGATCLMMPGGVPVPPVPPAVPRSVSRDTGENRVTSGTRVTYRTFYLGCSHEVTQEMPATSELIGLTREEISLMDWEWRLTSFEKGHLHLSRIEEGFCPEDSLYRWIGIMDGYVAVFYGKPRPDPCLKQLTKIKVSALYEEDRARLERGVWVEGDRAVEEVLEGLVE